MKIYAPVKDFTGLRNNVRFANGVGETDDPALLEWFRTHGYKVPIDDSRRVEQAATVRVEDIATQLVEEVGDADQPNFEKMAPHEIRNWAKANGLGDVIGNIRSKDKLLQLVRG